MNALYANLSQSISQHSSKNLQRETSSVPSTEAAVFVKLNGKVCYDIFKLEIMFGLYLVKDVLHT